MTILLGSLSNNAGVVTIVPPAGFNSVQAVRLSNYCNGALILGNIGSANQQSLLMPVQQNVYAAPNVNQNLTLASLNGSDTPAQIMANVYAEFSTDPQYDFAGYSYPAQLSVPSQVVAEAIFAQGVPTVLLQDLLISLPGAFTISPGTALTPVPIGKYASLLVQINGTKPIIHAQFDQAATWSGIDYMTDEWFTHIDGPNSVATWIVPVNAQSVVFSNPGTNAANLVVYGTNRLVPKLTQLGKTTVPRLFTSTPAIAGGATVQLLTGDSLADNTSRFNGYCRWSFNPNIGGTVQYRWLDCGNQIRTESIGAVAASTTNTGFFAHPNAPVLWQYVNGPTASGAPILPLVISQA